MSLESGRRGIAAKPPSPLRGEGKTDPDRPCFGAVANQRLSTAPPRHTRPVAFVHALSARAWRRAGQFVYTACLVIAAHTLRGAQSDAKAHG